MPRALDSVPYLKQFVCGPIKTVIVQKISLDSADSIKPLTAELEFTNLFDTLLQIINQGSSAKKRPVDEFASPANGNTSCSNCLYQAIPYDRTTATT